MMPSHDTAGRAPAGMGRVVLFALVSGVLLGGTGCGSLGLRRSADKKLSRRSIDGPSGVAGPTERKLLADRWRKERAAGGKDPAMERALAKYDAAEDLYNSGKYGEAEDAFKKLAKERRGTYEKFRNRWERWWGTTSADEIDPYVNYGDPVEEDALFMVAESQFAQKRYSWAQDSYDTLLSKYPSTRHMEPSTRRLFRIAMYWLDFSSDVGSDGDVKLASHETINPQKPPKAPQIPPVPIIPNVTDRSKPVFDQHGRALQALRSIWLHDAAGPLADDALMLSANHHLRTGDFVEATRLYKLLREQYPDSPHFRNAHLIGAYVTMASYEGSTYDGAPLTEAKQLKQAALQLFPDISDEERARLEKEVRRLDEAEVGRLWDKVEFYKAKNQPQSIAVYCHKIINLFPESKYAELARQEVRRIEGMKRHRSKSASNPPAANPQRRPEATDEPAKLELDESDASPVELPGTIELDE
jgi:hypothetical protein